MQGKGYIAGNKDARIAFYESIIEENLDFIRYLASQDKLMQSIRESFYKKPEIVKLCKSILIESRVVSDLLAEEIEDARKEIEFIREISNL